MNEACDAIAIPCFSVVTELTQQDYQHGAHGVDNARTSPERELLLCLTVWSLGRHKGTFYPTFTCGRPFRKRASHLPDVHTAPFSSCTRFERKYENARSLTLSCSLPRGLFTARIA
jgi:hypothetical protein